MALCMLPEVHIRSQFTEILNDANSDQLRVLAEYVQKTWLENQTWKIKNISVFGAPIRTNNDAEGWHFRINKKGRRNMPFYWLVELLHQEAGDVNATVELVSQKILKRRQSVKYRSIQSRIISTWNDYEDGKILPSEMLNRLAKIYR